MTEDLKQIEKNQVSRDDCNLKRVDSTFNIISNAQTSNSDHYMQKLSYEKLKNILKKPHTTPSASSKSCTPNNAQSENSHAMSDNSILKHVKHAKSKPKQQNSSSSIDSEVAKALKHGLENSKQIVKHENQQLFKALNLVKMNNPWNPTTFVQQETKANGQVANPSDKNNLVLGSPLPKSEKSAQSAERNLKQKLSASHFASLQSTEITKGRSLVRRPDFDSQKDLKMKAYQRDSSVQAANHFLKQYKATVSSNSSSYSPPECRSPKQQQTDSVSQNQQIAPQIPIEIVANLFNQVSGQQAIKNHLLKPPAGSFQRKQNQAGGNNIQQTSSIKGGFSSMNHSQISSILEDLNQYNELSDANLDNSQTININASKQSNPNFLIPKSRFENQINNSAIKRNIGNEFFGANLHEESQGTFKDMGLGSFSDNSSSKDIKLKSKQHKIAQKIKDKSSPKKNKQLFLGHPTKLGGGLQHKQQDIQKKQGLFMHPTEIDNLSSESESEGTTKMAVCTSQMPISEKEVLKQHLLLTQKDEPTEPIKLEQKFDDIEILQTLIAPKRGRPRKLPLPEQKTENSKQSEKQTMLGKRTRGRPRTKPAPVTVEKKAQRQSLKAIANWIARHQAQIVFSDFIKNDEVREKAKTQGISYVSVQHTCINEIFRRKIVKISEGLTKEQIKYLENQIMNTNHMYHLKVGTDSGKKQSSQSEPDNQEDQDNELSLSNVDVQIDPQLWKKAQIKHQSMNSTSILLPSQVYHYEMWAKNMRRRVFDCLNIMKACQYLEEPQYGNFKLSTLGYTMIDQENSQFQSSNQQSSSDQLELNTKQKTSQDVISSTEKVECSTTDKKLASPDSKDLEFVNLQKSVNTISDDAGSVYGSISNRSNATSSKALSTESKIQHQIKLSLAKLKETRKRCKKKRAQLQELSNGLSNLNCLIKRNQNEVTQKLNNMETRFVFGGPKASQSQELGKSVLFGDEKIKFPLIVLNIQRHGTDEEVVLNKRGRRLEIESKLPIVQFNEMDILTMMSHTGALIQTASQRDDQSDKQSFNSELLRSANSKSSH